MILYNFLGVPIDINTLTQLAIDFSGRLVLALLIFFVGQWIGKRIVGVAKHIMVKKADWIARLPTFWVICYMV